MHSKGSGKDSLELSSTLVFPMDFSEDEQDEGVQGGCSRSLSLCDKVVEQEICLGS